MFAATMMMDRPAFPRGGIRTKSNTKSFFTSCFRKLASKSDVEETPEETRARIAKEEAASEAYLRSVKRCPHCQIGHQRHGACHAITCLCGGIFCYECGAATEKNTNEKTRQIYNHTSNCIYSIDYYSTENKAKRENLRCEEKVLALD